MSLPRDIVTEAIRYWEPRRIVYNFVLIVVTLFSGMRALEITVTEPPIGYVVFSLAVLTVGANLCYCAAYTVDIFIQQSDFQEEWRRRRFLLFIAGTLFASLLAFFICEWALSAYGIAFLGFKGG